MSVMKLVPGIAAILLLALAAGCASSGGAAPSPQYKDCWDGSSVPEGVLCPAQSGSESADPVSPDPVMPDPIAPDEDDPAAYPYPYPYPEPEEFPAGPLRACPDGSAVSYYSPCPGEEIEPGAPSGGGPTAGVYYKDCYDGSTVPVDAACPEALEEGPAPEAAPVYEEPMGELDEGAAFVADCLAAGTCEGVNILFGSNREIEFGRQAENFNRFGRDPETPFKDRNARTLTLGEVFVTVPRSEDRRAGTIDRPPALFGQRIGFELDPTRHFVFVRYGELSERAFLDALDAKDSAFLFVHGFNVSFESAAMRAAQLKVDGRYDGQAMIYSWPTKHVRLRPGPPYRASQREAEAARRHFRDFLRMIRDDGQSRKLHIVAHSMGNYMMMEVLAALREEAADGGLPLFGEIIFAAPDVDRDEFVDLARRIDGLGRGMTLYASSRDVSMEIARNLCRTQRGRACPPRAGDVPEQGPIALRDSDITLDTIDASNLPNRDFLPLDEHDYFGGDIQILRDIADLLQTGERAPRSSIWDEGTAGGARYWIFPCAQGYCQ